MSPYEALAELAEHELDLVEAGAIDRLPALGDRRQSLIAALPATPPAEARLALQRAAAAQTRVTAALAARRDAIGTQIARLTHGSTALAGYKPPVSARLSLDRSA